MKKYLIGGGLMLIAAGIGFAVFFSTHAAVASSASPNITFPVAALGNCTDLVTCHAYCNIPAHMQACTAFAENNGIQNVTSTQESTQFAKILENGGGPGGCNSPDSCDAYCSNISHLNACISFAKANGFMDDNLAQGEKIGNYLQAGGHMPGNCDSKDSCMAYCSDKSHMVECAQFAENAGLPQGGPPGSNGAISPQEQQTFNAILQAGKTPGGCATLQACLVYCDNISNGSACGAFGEAMGASQENMQVQQAGPGGCTSDVSCKAYCADSAHAAECKQFEIQSGQKGPMQAGPGGCNSDASCQAYCKDPAHADECQQFARQSGNYVQGTSTGTGNRAGTCGENQYWNGSECVSSGPVQTGGPGSTQPPCPAGQDCHYQMDQGSSSQSSSSLPNQQANILSIFGGFIHNFEQNLGL